MPSLPHTVLLELLRRAPPLVATLLREGCAAPLPRFAAAQVVEGELRLLVLTTRPAVARWCSRPIDMGDGRWVLVPDVLGPEQIPQVTRACEARRRPELAVLSVLAHGRGPRGAAIGRAALAGVTMLDSARRPL